METKIKRARFHLYFGDVYTCQTPPFEGLPFTLTEIYAKYRFPQEYDYYAPTDGVLEVVLREPRKARAAQPATVEPAAMNQAGADLSGRYCNVPANGQGSLF